MCILFIYRNPNADAKSYRLILAGNRDEIFKRPALPAHYWKEYPTCLGGIDMEPGKEGGTWFALSIKGKAGIILNLSNEPGNSKSPKKGRGTLVNDYITSNDSAESYLKKLHSENQITQGYNPYNLILINLYTADVYYLSSSLNSSGPKICQDNILGFGNSTIECPYKKVEAGKESFSNIVHNIKTSDQDELIENLLQLLKSRERHLPDLELQKRSPNMYVELSSIFVSLADYSTRTHTILMIDGLNQMTFVEETLMPDFSWKRQSFNSTLITN
ncbi:transport and Golgi organization protein 2 isoform X1 [Vespa crabro]|uniref:transport and Golgi organization protein 2 isoform X1 n=1 Tax=Vespa crabro TaxID=7445 RepID=UPI001F001FDB|nr:transport and Golgi organization protein 2 isoform X1 [Vespa crabro]